MENIVSFIMNWSKESKFLIKLCIKWDWILILKLYIFFLYFYKFNTIEIRWERNLSKSWSEEEISNCFLKILERFIEKKDVSSLQYRPLIQILEKWTQLALKQKERVMRFETYFQLIFYNFSLLFLISLLCSLFYRNNCLKRITKNILTSSMKKYRFSRG